MISAIGSDVATWHLFRQEGKNASWNGGTGQGLWASFADPEAEATALLLLAFGAEVTRELVSVDEGGSGAEF